MLIFWKLSYTQFTEFLFKPPCLKHYVKNTIALEFLITLIKIILFIRKEYAVKTYLIASNISFINFRITVYLVNNWIQYYKRMLFITQ